MRRTKNAVHSSRDAKKAVDAGTRSSELSARASTAAQNDEKNSVKGESGPEDDREIICIIRE